MTLYELYGILETGLIFSLVALGAFLTFRVLDFPDLTVEGSFPLGAAVAAVLMVNGLNAWLAILVASVAGFIAGVLTGWFHVRFKIVNILSGILVAVALYSINLRIMNGPNVPLIAVDTVFTPFEAFFPSSSLAQLTILAVIIAAITVALNVFLATGFGISMRSAGANPSMAAAFGIDVGRMKIIGLGIANAMTALGGALFAQLFGAADAYMGIGVIIVGLAAVIVGTTLFPARSILQCLLACIAGAVLYRLVVALSLNGGFLGLKASDMQLITSVLVLGALILQRSGALKKVTKRGKA
ncbi:ABC transporter permease [Ochrobactrum vermis]|uniref:ABC transporter permease n=1 Tax=Ochrobactrum vermis TaxID=1827297 RepID=A0ABU8PLY1_9HYPH|nr:ABC transporter permease [Ochrobactrum vermis]PQZ24439.1 ABC transporter permease [Ochrobactrum vermis]